LENFLYTSGDYAILAYPEPLVNISKLSGYTDDIVNNGSGTIFKKQFRYSFDNETFSEYFDMDVESLSPLTWIENNSVWFQFRYTLLSGGPAQIKSVTLQYSIYSTDEFDGFVPANKQDESKVYAFPITYKTGAKWNPYKMNRAVRLYKDLNLMVNSLFGHEVQYYRVLPQGRSRDVYLMEYSLYEHDKMQCMKVVIPNNQFPDNKLSMGPFGVDFEMPFEIQIDKGYFQAIFGDGAGPQKRDVIWFPNTDRIYEISSSYLFRDFMNEPLYFKATLIKWLPKAGVDMTTDLDAMALETLAPSVGKFFGEEQVDEGTDITNPEQFQQTTTTSDPVRFYVDENIKITDIPVMNYYLKIAEYQYALSDSVKETQAVQDAMIKYKAIGNFLSTDDRAYSAWFNIPTNTRFSASATLSSIDEDNLSCVIGYFYPHTFNVGDTVSVRRISGGNFNLIGTVKEVYSDKQILIEFSSEILSHLNRVFPTWKTYIDFNVQLTYPRVFIDSLNGGKGIRIDLLEKRYFRVFANSQIYYFFLPNTQSELSENKWYNICVSLSNLFSQLTLNVWEIQWNETTKLPATSDLRQIYGKTVNDIPKEDRSSTINYFIPASDMQLTNIRVWSQKIETDKQPFVLNQNIVKDASRAIVIDNAIPQSHLPYISYTH
jgi:hypothetical protein